MTGCAEVDVSFVINLHREGALCRASLESARTAIVDAKRSGLRAELLLVLDRPDSSTIAAAETAGSSAKVLTVDVGDLGEARNCAVRAARGHYVAFMDGDDLCCSDWLIKALAEAKTQENRIVVHPKFNLFFGRNYERYFWIHPDMRTDDISLSRMLVENLWTASVLTHRDIFLEFPYRQNRLAAGYGYEDWVWNIETAAAGIKHITAADTILFIRKNKQGSLLDASSAIGVLPDVRSIFKNSVVHNESIRA